MPSSVASTGSTASTSSSVASGGAPIKRKTDEGAKKSMANGSTSNSKMVELAPGDELNLQRTTKKPGEGVVTKRTLQNRKAQREFRKRREARVRELEERCRRYDQMGIEANTELQRFARNLKEENEALRNFIVRIGCGNAIPSLLEGIASQNTGMHHQQGMPFGSNGSQQSMFGGPPQAQLNQLSSPSGNQQPVFGGMFGGNEGMTGGSFGSNEPQFYNEQMNASSNTQKPTSLSQAGRQRSQSVKVGKGLGGREESDQPLLSLNLVHEGRNGQQQPQQQPDFAPTSSHESQKLDMTQSRGTVQSPSGTGLTAFLANHQQQQQAQQQNAGNQGSGNTGSGTGGTAMLFNGTQGNNNGNSNNGPFINGGFGAPATFAPVPIPQRSQQNAALLNPNPIPFAFNLSSNDLNAQAPSSWWDSMGGGNDDVELDEKAQALATAQANRNGGTQSPFDLSTFLNGGVTPGGGFQLNPMDAISPAPAADGTAMNAATLASDTEHMRMFVNLIERKVAERDARNVASLGFQPPSQDPAHRKRSGTGKLQETRAGGAQSPAIRMSRSLTPSGVYSRLAQHPAFLSTNARELEELVDALGPVDSETGDKAGRARNANSLAGANATSSPLSQGSSPATQGANPVKMERAPSGTGRSASNADSSTDTAADGSRRNVHVDEGAIGKLLGLLDQKRGSTDSNTGASGSSAGGSSSGGSDQLKQGEGTPGNGYTMTMA